jgi:hypothetical protein
MSVKAMTARVIQGSFVGGGPRLSSPVAQPTAMPRLPGPPAPAFAGRPPVAQPRLPGPPVPAFAGRPPVAQPRLPGPPAPAFAGRPPVGQRHGSGGAFAVDAGQVGLISGGGRPLPEAVRGKMEAVLGANFADVRMHVGPQAERIGAIAFTIGSDVYFAPGRFQPDTAHGQQLLGHELAHVVQQRAGRVKNPLGSGLAVVQDHALEAEADRLGRHAAAQRMPAQAKMVDPIAARGSRAPLFASRSLNRLQRPAPSSRVERPEQPATKWAAPMRQVVARPPQSHSGRATLQRYLVIGPTKIYRDDGAMAAGRQLRPSDDPVALVKGAGYFAAQTKKPGVRKEDEYLDTTGGGGDQVNIIKASRSKMSLRVSDDLNMAIEEAPKFLAGGRQPKTFFASDPVISKANRELKKVGGFVELKKEAQYIKIFKDNKYTRLYRVSPKFSGPTPQNCDALAKKIIGLNTTPSIVLADNAVKALEMITGVKRDFDKHPEEVDYSASVVRQYVDKAPRDLHKLHKDINTRANPKVGEAFAIWTINPGKAELNTTEKAKVLDILSQEIRELDWGSHFAGVVATSGKDRVVLENYARADKRAERPDPRWFFQMYGELRGQSFHEVQAGSGGFANPITVVVAEASVGRYVDTMSLRPDFKRPDVKSKKADNFVIFELRHDPKYNEIHVYREENIVVSIIKGRWNPSDRSRVPGPAVLPNSQLGKVAIEKAARHPEIF